MSHIQSEIIRLLQLRQAERIMDGYKHELRENCLEFSIFSLKKGKFLLNGVSGRVEDAEQIIHFKVSIEKESGAIDLSYRRNGGIFIYKIALQMGVPNISWETGIRWWFRCPACMQVVGKLFLAPNFDYFACRKCLNLTYWSRNRPKKKGFARVCV